MSPTLPEGNLILLSRLAYKFEEVQPKDVLVFREPKQSIYVIKRCALVPGMPLQWRKKNLYIPHLGRYVSLRPNVYSLLQKYREIPKGFIFVLGDNSLNSVDSRDYGLVPIKNIRGKAIWTL